MQFHFNYPNQHLWPTRQLQVWFGIVLINKYFHSLFEFSIEDGHVIPGLIHKCYLAKKNGLISLIWYFQWDTSFSLYLTGMNRSDRHGSDYLGHGQSTQAVHLLRGPRSPHGISLESCATFTKIVVLCFKLWVGVGDAIVSFSRTNHPLCGGRRRGLHCGRRQIRCWYF